MMVNPNRKTQLGLLFIIFLFIVLCFYSETTNIAKELEQNDNDDSAFYGQKYKVLGPQLEQSITTTDDGDLPISVVNHVKTFVFFLGHARSGHSILGSLLDSHPHIVIAHEADLFRKLSAGSIAPEKSAIFNAVWKNTINTTHSGMRSVTSNGKGYTLYVDGLYQGKYVNYIDVIGDKKGGTTTKILYSQPDKWSDVFNILNSLVDSVKVIHCIRNPYDNIATGILYSFTPKMKAVFGIIKQSNETFKVDPHKVRRQIKNYFLYHQTIEDAKRTYNLDVIEIHSRDLINDPRGTLLSICNNLGVTCSDHYLEICSNKVFKTESKTRHMIKWSSEQLEMIQQNINKHDSLKDYNFNS